MIGCPPEAVSYIMVGIAVCVVAMCAAVVASVAVYSYNKYHE